MTDPAEFIQTHGPEALTSLLQGASDLQAHLAARVLLHGESPGRDVLARSAFEPVGPSELHAAAAYLLVLAGRTRAMLRQEVEDRGASLEREALAWLARHPEDAPEDDGEEQLFTGDARLLIALAIQHGRRRGRKGWDAVADLAEGAALHMLDGLVGPRPAWWLTLSDELVLELDACRAIRRPSKRAVERLVSGVDVRARRVEAALVPVLEAIAGGEPLLDTGERLRAALRALEGRC